MLYLIYIVVSGAWLHYIASAISTTVSGKGYDEAKIMALSASLVGCIGAILINLSESYYA